MNFLEHLGNWFEWNPLTADFQSDSGQINKQQQRQQNNNKKMTDVT